MNVIIRTISFGRNLTRREKKFNMTGVDTESDIVTLTVLFALFVANFSLPALFWVSVFTFFHPKPPLRAIVLPTHTLSLSRFSFFSFFFFSKARNPAHEGTTTRALSTLLLLLCCYRAGWLATAGTRTLPQIKNKSPVMWCT